MSAKYIAKEPHSGRITPRCDLPGSPFGSRLQAKEAAKKAKIKQPIITKVRRRAA